MKHLNKDIQYLKQKLFASSDFIDGVFAGGEIQSKQSTAFSIVTL